MSKIEIREVDLTEIEQAATLTDDIVYVPGFSSLGNVETAAKAKEPVLCNTVAEFVNKFGDRPALFKTSQPYSSLSGSFATEAIPTVGTSSANMFEIDTPDPSYIYARELLALGIPVVYERVNEVADDSSTDYDVDISTMYNFLSTNFRYSTDLTCSSNNISVEFTSTTGVPTFVSHFPDVGRYQFVNIGKTAINIDYGSTKTSDKFIVTLDRDTFITNYSTVTVDGYTFIYKNVGTEQEPEYKWVYNNTPIEDFSTTGISYTLKPNTSIADGDQIVVKTIAYGWKNNVTDKIYEIDYLGITISSGTPTTDPATIIFVVHSKKEPKLIDKNLYSIKYLTSGGYPTFEYSSNTIVADFIKLCQDRGDCIALIDHTDNPERDLTGVSSVYNSINLNYYINSSYATMFTPYCRYPVSYGSYSEISLPASFAYLSCLAKSVANNPSWLAIAGAARGKVANLIAVDTDSVITNSIAEGYQSDNSVDINPITNIRPYGQCIWGNRTLVDNGAKGGTTALSFLNIRNLVCDVKKTVYSACQQLMFEQNTDVLWINFLSRVTPRLDQMVSGYGLKNYKIIRQYPSDKSKIVATIRLYPVYAVESFDITIYLQDGDTSVVE